MNWIDPLLRITDDSGAPVSGGKVYVFEAGTTTPLATYSDRDRTVANTHPVVADGNGYAGPIYVPDQAFKLRVTDSAGVTLYEEDDLAPANLITSADSSLLDQIAQTPIRYGAVGDGVADESTAVQAAVDAATCTVDLLGKTYRCDTTIYLPGGVTLCNGTLDFRQSDEDEYLTGKGSLGTAILLTADVAATDTTLSLASVSGLAADDWLYLYSSTQPGTLVQIKSIAALDVTLTSGCPLAYATANAAAVKRVSMLEDTVLDNLKIVCSESATGTGNAVVLQHCNRPRINIVVSGAKAIGLQIDSCVNTTFDEHLLIERDADSSAVGLDVMGATVGGVVRGTFRSLATGVRVGNNGTASDTNGVHVAPTCTFDGCTATIEIGSYALSTVTGYVATGHGTTENGVLGTGASGAAGVRGVGGANSDGIQGQGTGTGVGGAFAGGDTGAGVTGRGGDTSGVGGAFTGKGASSGVTGTGGATNGVGVSGTGSGTGAGVTGTGGGSGATGVVATGGGVNGMGLQALGKGTEPAIEAHAESLEAPGIEITQGCLYLHPQASGFGAGTAQEGMIYYSSAAKHFYGKIDTGWVQLDNP